MDSKDLKILKDLIYNENEEKLKSEIKKMDSSLFLHIIAANYNWDNGFDIPYLIINNSSCDLGTALMMFYNADGFRLLESGDGDISAPSISKWKEFIKSLYHKIIENSFKTQSISYSPQISKVQIYKLKKNNPSIPSILLERSPGIEVDVPVL